MLDVMRDTVTKNLLKYAAGHRMFCPNCGDVMDWRRTVIVKDSVVCDECFVTEANNILLAATDEQVENFRHWLADVDLTSAHDWRVEGRVLVKGKRQL